MQVSVETTQGLERRITVQVPSARVDDEVVNRLRDLRGRVRLDGFRPGKVPLKVVQQRYGAQVRNEVMSEVLESTYGEALQQEDLRPAGQPHVEPVRMEAGSDLEYTATFEVLPAIQVEGVDRIKAERPVVDITDADIDSLIERLRAQNATYAPLDRAAAKGDRVTFDFHGTIDGEEFEGNAGVDTTTEIGSGQMPDAFEEQLVGRKPDEHCTIDYEFPEQFPDEKVAGRTASFEVTVKSVEEAQLPTVDDAFAESLGLEGGLSALRERVRESLQRERDQAVRAKLKSQVMDGLLEQNQLDLPKVLVDGEIEQLREQMRQRMQQYGQEIDIGNLPAEHFEEEARRRVSLGLLVNEIVRGNNLQLEPQRLQEALQSAAAGHDDPQQIIQYYQQNRQLMQNLEVQAMEEQVVDWILEQATITERPMTFDEVMSSEETASTEE